jgi:U6 snRNA-associated Sm-like protein LSm3
MNLILSDVEETIMIVDVAEGAPLTQGTVHVCIQTPIHVPANLNYFVPQVAKRKVPMLFVRGDGVILVRFSSNLSAHRMLMLARCPRLLEHD